MSLQIIPVIDLMGGIVVHARKGQRENYREIDSVLSSSSEPFEFIKALLLFHPFKTIYLADLDAIETGVLNTCLYKNLVEGFPLVKFWLDAGVRTRLQWQELNKIHGLTVILASETLQDLDLLTQADILSLDFKDGQLLGNETLLQDRTLWPKTVIVLGLNSVGSNTGPEIDLVKQLGLDSEEEINLILGGGVRDEADLVTLADSVQGVLIASALHEGRIGRTVVSKYQ